MRVLYVDTFTCYPLGLAGGHRSNHALLLALARAEGGACRVVVPRDALGAPRGRYFPRPEDFAALGIRDFRDLGDGYFFDCGYPIWVVDDLLPEVERALDDFAPDVLFTSSIDPMPFADLARRRGVPTVCCMRDDRFKPEAMRALVEGGGRLLACSRFMAAWLEREVGVRPEVLYPAIEGALYQVEPAADGAITFINPVEDKGLSTFLEIVPRFPDERFLVVESWPLNDGLEAVRAALGSFPNVRFLERLADIREVYRQTRLVLVPSLFEEPAGRVVVEAHWSGIPALVSRRGGLPEMLGGGGMVVDDFADPGAWERAIRAILAPEAWARCSRLAHDNARRADFSAPHLASRLREVCKQAIAAMGAVASRG